jgi:hypothetical protein
MKPLLQTSAFKVGFLAGLCLFVGLNSFSHQSPVIHQLFHEYGPFSVYDSNAYGFPFSFYIWGSGGLRWSAFFWSELAADVVIAVVASLLIGFVVNSLWPKIKSAKMPAL